MTELPPPANPEPGQPSLEHPLTMVCGRLITGGNAAYYHPTLFHGAWIYFCTDFCLEAFQADPERFYAAHHKVKAAPAGSTAAPKK